jgi:hypothetical protein
MKITIFCDVISAEEAAASIFRVQDGGTRFVRNVCNDVPDNGVMSRKTVTFTDIILRNSNPTQYKL